MRKYFNGILAVIVLLMTVYLMYEIGYIPHVGEMCIGDGIRNVLSSKCAPKLIALFTIYYLYITRDEFHTMFLLKRKSRKDLWKKQMKDCCILAFLFSTVVIMVSLVSSSYYYKDGGIMNWNKYYSGYAIQSRGIISDIGLAAVCAKGWTLLLLQTLSVLVFSQLLIWLTNIRALPLIFIIAAAINDGFTYTPLFFSRFNYRINQWGDIKFTSLKPVFYLIGITVVLVAIGYLYSEHKEFIGEQNA